MVNMESGSSSQPMPILPPNLRIRETLTRLIQIDEEADQSRGGITLSHNAIHCIADERKDCLIEETLVDGLVIGLRIRNLSKPDIPFNGLTLPYYKAVTRFDISWPVSSIWVFDWIASLPELKYLRFGIGFFNDCQEGIPTKKFERSPSVKELCISFDKKAFDSYEKKKQERLKNKLDNILDLCSVNLTGLEFVDLTLPIGPTLDIFLKKLPKIKGNGEKIENYQSGTVCFRTLKQQRPHHLEKRPCPTQPKPNPKVPPKKIKDEPIPPVSQKSPNSPIEVVDLSGDEENRTTSPNTGHSDHIYGKRNGRGSPSLL